MIVVSNKYPQVHSLFVLHVASFCSVVIFNLFLTKICARSNVRSADSIYTGVVESVKNM